MSEFEPMRPSAGEGRFLSLESPASSGGLKGGNDPEAFEPLKARATPPGEGRLVSVQRLAVAIPPAAKDVAFELLGSVANKMAAGLKEPGPQPDVASPLDALVGAPVEAHPVVLPPPELSEQEQEAFAAGLVSLEAARDEIYSRGIEDMVQAIMLIARRVVRRELRTDAELVERTVRSALEEMQDESSVVVHISSEQERLMGASADELAQRIGLNELRVVVDPSLAGLGCVVKTRSGEIKALVEEQLQRFFSALEVDLRDADDDDWSMP